MNKVAIETVCLVSQLLKEVREYRRSPAVIQGVACQILWPGEVGAYSEGECIIALAHI